MIRTLGGRCLLQLSQLPDFKMYGYNQFEADGIKFSGTHLSVEDGLYEALIFIEVRREIRQMIKHGELEIKVKDV